MFISTVDGFLFPVSRIVKAWMRKDEKWGRRIYIELDDETLHCTFLGSDEDLTRIVSGTIIPAHPGYEVLNFTSYSANDVGEFFYWREDIIAWHLGIAEWDYPTPITPSGQNMMDREFAILTPSGRVHVQEDSDYDSLKDWEIAFKERWEKTKRERAEKK